MNEETYNYIGKRSCGCITAVIADRPEMKVEIAKELPKWIKDGMTIERVTTAYVRANFGYCKDHKPKKQIGLFEAETV